MNEEAKAAIERSRKVAHSAFRGKNPGMLESIAVLGSTIVIIGEHGEAIFICGADLSKVASCCQIAEGGLPGKPRAPKRRK